MSSFENHGNGNSDSKQGISNTFSGFQNIFATQQQPQCWNVNTPSNHQMGTNVYFQDLIQNLQGPEYVFQPQQTNHANTFIYPPSTTSATSFPYYGTAANPFAPTQARTSNSNSLPIALSNGAAQTNVPFPLKVMVPSSSTKEHTKQHHIGQQSLIETQQQNGNQSPLNHSITSSFDGTGTTSPTSGVTSMKKPRLSAAAQERRRERNKLLARKTRQKKKVESELLRDQLVSLMLENNKLKEVLSQANHSGSSSNEKHRMSASELLQNAVIFPENIQEMINHLIKDEQNHAEVNLVSRQRSYIIVNPNAPDAPIVYASDGFLRLTGYTRQECIGRNCRFLQGEDTDYEEVRFMQEALLRQEDFTAVILNYTKQKQAFWNMIEVGHIRDHLNRVRYIVGLQNECQPNAMRVRLARQRYEYHQQQAQHAEQIQQQQQQQKKVSLQPNPLPHHIHHQPSQHHTSNNNTDSSTARHNPSSSSSSSSPGDITLMKPSLMLTSDNLRLHSQHDYHPHQTSSMFHPPNHLAPSSMLITQSQLDSTMLSSNLTETTRSNMTTSTTNTTITTATTTATTTTATTSDSACSMELEERSRKNSPDTILNTATHSSGTSPKSLTNGEEEDDKM